VEVRGLALVTELALAATRGSVLDRGDYIVVERRDAPTWAYGNYLALPRAPMPTDLPRWIDVFTRELGSQRAIALRWDDPTGEADALPALCAAGFAIDRVDVLAATEVVAPPHAAMRTLDAREVLATTTLAWELADRHDEEYRRFLHARSSWHSALVSRRLASFWGAFAGANLGDAGTGSGKLVASAGLVRIPPLGRFQDVQTLPAYRRRGLAGALLAALAREARAHGVRQFVAFAEAGDEAARVYGRVGFQRVERAVLARRTR
jgi:GNAT superfamily N-acetyltransferase